MGASAVGCLRGCLVTVGLAVVLRVSWAGAGGEGRVAVAVESVGGGGAVVSVVGCAGLRRLVAWGWEGAAGVGASVIGCLPLRGSPPAAVCPVCRVGVAGDAVSVAGCGGLEGIACAGSVGVRVVEAAEVVAWWVRAPVFTVALAVRARVVVVAEVRGDGARALVGPVVVVEVFLVVVGVGWEGVAGVGAASSSASAAAGRPPAAPPRTSSTQPAAGPAPGSSAPGRPPPGPARRSTGATSRELRVRARSPTAAAALESAERRAASYVAAVRRA